VYGAGQRPASRAGQVFERVLQQTREDVPIPVCPYALMPNHWHLLLWPEPKATTQGQGRKDANDARLFTNIEPVPLPAPSILCGRPGVVTVNVDKIDAGRRRMWKAICLLALTTIVLLALPLGCELFNQRMREQLLEGHERLQERHLADLVAEVQSRKTNAIHLYDIQDTDEFLKSIEVLRGLNELEVDSSDVTDSGMKHISRMPDLKALRLFHLQITDAGLETLKTHHGLEELEVTPNEASNVSIPTILALPNLRKLKLCNPHGEAWIEFALTELKQATKLRELILVGTTFSAADIADLRQSLPDCVVKTNAVNSIKQFGPS
jgi:hypothetical protein